MTSAELDRFTSRRSTVFARNGLIATSQPLAASAGVRMLQSGGNAFDAAVSAAAALNVVEPTSTGLGGDVFALYRTAEGEIGAMRSCGGAPGEATIAAVRNRLAEATGEDPEAVEMPYRGPHTVTVPGTARGWEAILDRCGRLNLPQVLDPAIAYATEGFPVSPVIASHWESAEELFSDDHARDAYLPNGRVPQTGEVARMPALGASLQTIAERGADPVYEGDIADAIVDEVRAKGGLLSHEDLATFSPEFIDPISVSYRGGEVYQLPPNNQGLIVLEALRIAERIDATDAQAGSVDRLHDLIEATKLAFQDGHRYITDPVYEDVPSLTDETLIAERANRIGRSARTATELPPPGARGEDSDTVLITAGDADGNLVSLINSRFAGFGSGLVAGETGIALQNRGAAFSLDPSDPNHIAPGKRPFHTLIPSIVRFGDEDWGAFGVMGGHMQPQGQVQILARLLADGDALQPALDAPRWRYRADGTVAVEPRLDPVVQTALVRRGHDLTVDQPSAFGGAQIVRKRGDVLAGATEPRKDGVAIGW